MLSNQTQDTDPLMDEPDRSSKPPPEAHPKSTPSIEVEGLDPLAPLSTDTLQELITNIQRALDTLPNTGQVRVQVVNDQRMSDAHKQFSGIQGTTDVLTFDLAPPTNNFDTKILDTDLIICFDEAQRQALTRNHPTQHELLLYTIHGVLHCLGYDDHNEKDFQRMHQREDEILSTIGIGKTFFSDTENKSHTTLTERNS